MAPYSARDIVDLNEVATVSSWELKDNGGYEDLRTSIILDARENKWFLFRISKQFAALLKDQDDPNKIVLDLFYPQDHKCQERLAFFDTAEEAYLALQRILKKEETQ